MKQIYLDYAAATPMDPAVLDVMQPYYSDRFYNPSALYLPAKQIALSVMEARVAIAHWLGSRPGEVFFTAGGTESNNLAVQGIMRRFPNGNMLVSSIEHESVLEPAGKYACNLLSVKRNGKIDLTQLESHIDDHTVLVSVMYANNEIGVIQPIKQVAELIKRLRHERQKKGHNRPLYLHSDACQAAGYLDLHVSRLGVDMLTLNGGKIYGPKQSGTLFVRSGVELEPLIYGGGQEHGLRSGTENVAATVGLAMALDLVQNRRLQETSRLQKIQKESYELIGKLLPQATINGSLKDRLPNNIHITLPGTDNERLIMALDEHGVCVAAGSACSASSDKPSHVLTAMGLSDAEARSSLRLTMGNGTKMSDMQTAIKLIAKLTYKANE